MGRPREYDDALRVRLVEAAARLLADEGVSAVTTRRVAAEVGTSTTAIYSLIGSKEELFRQMHREGFQRLADHLAEVEITTDLLDDLARLGRAYHAMAVENPHLYNVMFGMSWTAFEPAAADLVLARSTLQVLVDAVARAVDHGCLAGNPNDLALELWSLNHGITSLGLTGMLGSAATVGRRLDDALGALRRAHAPSGDIRPAARDDDGGPGQPAVVEGKRRSNRGLQNTK